MLLTTLNLADYKRTDSPVQQSLEDIGDGEPRQGEASKALNMVIKLWQINGKACIKISDGECPCESSLPIRH